MRVLRTLPVLLSLDIACANNCCEATGRVQPKKASRSAHFGSFEDSPRQTSLQLTTIAPSTEGEALVDISGRSSVTDLASLLPRAGGATGGLDGKSKGKKSRALVTRSVRGRTVTVNAIQWLAAIASGAATIRWTRSKEGPAEGAVRKALVATVVSSAGIWAVSNTLEAMARGNEANGQGQGGGNVSPGLGRFRWSYVGVLAAFSLAECIQAPFLYNIYQNKLFSSKKIIKLNLASSSSSAVTGLFAGSLLDRFGRRSGCMLYVILNIVQCALICYGVFGAHILARVLAGAGSMLMATASESWVVTEHRSRGFPSHMLAGTFQMASWAASAAAISAGFMGNSAVKAAMTAKQQGGPLATFFQDINLAPILLGSGVSLVMLALIARLWKENYGERSFTAFQQIREAFSSIMCDSRLLMLILVQALVEGSMLVWISFWIPAIYRATTAEQSIEIGVVFSMLMASMCGGSSLFKVIGEGLLPARFTVSPAACVLFATGLSTVALAAAAKELSVGRLLVAFGVYEACLGMYLPAMGTLRSKHIDERLRGTITTIARVPMYLLVIAVTLSVVGMGPEDSNVLDLPMEDLVPVMSSTLASLSGVATLVQVLFLQREGEASIASSGSGAVARQSKEIKGREAANAKRPGNGPPSTAGWGGTSFPRFTFPLGRAPATAPTADMPGVSAGWVSVPLPSNSQWAMGMVAITAPSQRAFPPKALTRPVVKESKESKEAKEAAETKEVRDVRVKAFPSILLAMVDAVKNKEWISPLSPQVSRSAARWTSTTTSTPSVSEPSKVSKLSKSGPDAKIRQGEAKGVPYSQKESFDTSKAKTDARDKSESPTNYRVASKTPRRSTEGCPDEAFLGASNGTIAMSPDSGIGKVFAIVSSVAGGLAWLLLRGSTQPASCSAQASQAVHDSLNKPFGDLNGKAGTGERHPSWSPPPPPPPSPSPSPSRCISNSKEYDGEGPDGDGDPWYEDKVPVEKGWGRNSGEGSKGSLKVKSDSNQYGPVGTGGGSFGNDNGEREAGVWVGWGGGCAF